MVSGPKLPGCRQEHVLVLAWSGSLNPGNRLVSRCRLHHIRWNTLNGLCSSAHQRAVSGLLVVGEGFHIGADRDSQRRAGATLVEELRRQSYCMAWKDSQSWINALRLVLRCECSLCSALLYKCRDRRLSGNRVTEITHTACSETDHWSNRRRLKDSSGA